MPQSGERSSWWTSSRSANRWTASAAWLRSWCSRPAFARSACRILRNSFGTVPEWNPGRSSPRIASPCEPSVTGFSFAERFARFMGTAHFLLWMSLFVVIWLLWNWLAPPSAQWDAYPFIFLTLMLSLQASYAAPLILLAQNRQEDRDRVIAEGDRMANARAHADMEFLAREMASLRMALGEVATRDYIRSELRILLNELEERGSREEGDAHGDGTAHDRTVG